MCEQHANFGIFFLKKRTDVCYVRCNDNCDRDITVFLNVSLYGEWIELSVDN